MIEREKERESAVREKDREKGEKERGTKARL